MAATAARHLSVILAAARTGRVTARSAREWASRAARGEDISVVAAFTAGAAPPITGPELTALASDLAAILATGTGAPISATGPGEMTDAEAALLWPPTTTADLDRRTQVAAAARQADHLSDDELHRALFGDTVLAGRQADAPASPAHVAFVGSHLHTHAAYDGSGGQHTHEHTHLGEASHDHGHEPG